MIDGRSQQLQAFESDNGDPSQVGHQTFIRWIVPCGARHRRLSCGKPASPKTVSGGIAAHCLPNRGSVGSGGSLSHSGCGRCEPSQPEASLG